MSCARFWLACRILASPSGEATQHTPPTLGRPNKKGKKKMRKELEVAAKNTVWRYIWLRAIYCDVEFKNSLEAKIFYESLMCAHYVRDALIRELSESGYEWILNRSHEYILSKYSTEYPELCLILCALMPFGTISPIGLSGDLALGSCVNRIFGTSCDSPLYHANFEALNIPIIRITDSVFTIGTNQPQFSTIDDIEDYYRDEKRIEEITKMCMFWIRKFYK